MVVEIVEALSRIKSIFVIAASSTLSLKGRGVGAQDAARLLGVGYVLDGNVRKATNRVRVGVQLIEAASGAQIWTQRFEDNLEDVFALQDALALSVAGVIEPTVEATEVRRASSRSTENMGCYDLCLRANALLRAYSRNDMLQALALAERAIALDPNYADALVMALLCRQFIAGFGWGQDAQANQEESRKLIRRALRVGPDDARTLASCAAAIAHFERDIAGAIALVDQAIALNPGSSYVWLTSGDLRFRAGQAEKGVEHIALGPNRAVQLMLLAAGRFGQGRYAECIAVSRQALPLIDNPALHLMVAAAYGHLQQIEAAREALDRYRALSTTPAIDFYRTLVVDPRALKPYLEGIALAEGKDPASGPADAH